jgi:hypothetical protein
LLSHDPPDLVEVSRRVVTYIITTLVIVGFCVAGFTASQTVFKAIAQLQSAAGGRRHRPAAFLHIHAIASLIRRWVNRWLNIQIPSEPHPACIQ